MNNPLMPFSIPSSISIPRPILHRQRPLAISCRRLSSSAAIALFPADALPFAIVLGFPLGLFDSLEFVLRAEEAVNEKAQPEKAEEAEAQAALLHRLFPFCRHRRSVHTCSRRSVFFCYISISQLHRHLLEALDRHLQWLTSGILDTQGTQDTQAGHISKTHCFAHKGVAISVLDTLLVMPEAIFIFHFDALKQE